jgi:hypothetical protein
MHAELGMPQLLAPLPRAKLFQAEVGKSVRGSALKWSRKQEAIARADLTIVGEYETSHTFTVCRDGLRM